MLTKQDLQAIREIVIASEKRILNEVDKRVSTTERRIDRISDRVITSEKHIKQVADSTGLILK